MFLATGSSSPLESTQGRGHGILAAPTTAKNANIDRSYYVHVCSVAALLSLTIAPELVHLLGYAELLDS